MVVHMMEYLVCHSLIKQPSPYSDGWCRRDCPCVMATLKAYIPIHNFVQLHDAYILSTLKERMNATPEPSRSTF